MGVVVFTKAIKKNIFLNLSKYIEIILTKIEKFLFMFHQRPRSHLTFMYDRTF